MKKTKQEKALEVLKKNEYEKYNDYVRGYIGATDIAKDIGIERTIIYLALEDIDPLATEKREKNQLKLLNDLVEKIERCIPYQSMHINEEELLGKKGLSEEDSVEVRKNKLRLKILNSNHELNKKAFQFVIQSKIDVWYRDYYIRKELFSKETTAYKVAQKFGIIPRKIYIMAKFFEENKKDDRFIKRVPLEQQKVFVENIKMFEFYKKGFTAEDISKKYNVKLILVKEVIDSLEKANQKLYSE